MKGVADTSRDSLRMSAARRATNQRRIAAALLHRPDTARGVGYRTGLGEHEASRRCSDLKALGLVVAVGATLNPDTGRPAQILAALPSVRLFLESRSEV